MIATDRASLAERYAFALRDFLAEGGEGALNVAYELGRRAVSDGLGLLDLVALHQDAQERVLRERGEPDGGLAATQASARFLAEGLSSYEMAHRNFQHAIAALRHLNEALEDEAKRFAHALHDETGQLLAAAHLAVREVVADLPPRHRDRVMTLHRPLDEIEKQIRRLSHELRPTVLDNLGLIPALEFLVQGVSARTGIPVLVEGPRSPRLPAAAEVVLYRVVQEAVRNATKHAQPSRIAIRIVAGDDEVRCSVRDDGRGFDVEGALTRNGGGGLGLIGIRERLDAIGGRLTIDSSPGRGTELAFAVPLGGKRGDPTAARG